MRQMGYVGKSRLEAAQRLLPDVLSNWSSQWCFGRQDLETVLAATVTAEAVDDASITAMDWQCAVTPNGGLWLGSRAPSSWHRLLFGAQAQEVPVDEVASYLTQQGQLTLANALLNALQQEPIAALFAEAPTATVTSCSARLLLAMPGHEADILLVLDASLLNAYLPIPAARFPLLDRQQAIGGARIKLKLLLPLSEISVADLSDLHPGDILKAATPLSQPFHLVTDRDALVAKGFLVRAHTKLAIQLTDR